MDPISQASFGASLSQSFAKDGKKQVSALVIGALAGMAPDLDIFIQSSVDPILFLEFHRQFTHSLVFIPFGALICTLLLYPLLGMSFFQISQFTQERATSVLVVGALVVLLGGGGYLVAHLFLDFDPFRPFPELEGSSLRDLGIGAAIVGSALIHHHHGHSRHAAAPVRYGHGHRKRPLHSLCEFRGKGSARSCRDEKKTNREISWYGDRQYQ